jgi:nitrogen regulatory protein PII
MNIILEQARTGLPGDGLIGAFPVDSLIKIRTCEKIEEGTCRNL